MRRSIVSVLAFAVCFVAALVLLLYLPIDLWRLSWPTTQGTIVTSQREWFVTTPANGKGFPIAKIQYSYHVGGIQHTSRNYNVSGPYGYYDPLSRESTIAALLRAYPVGAVVKVYHKPGSPNEAVIRPHKTPTEWAYIVVMNFLLGMVIGVSWLAYKAGGFPWKRNVQRSLHGGSPHPVERTT